MPFGHPQTRVGLTKGLSDNPTGTVAVKLSQSVQIALF